MSTDAGVLTLRKTGSHVTAFARILALGVAQPPYEWRQDDLCDAVCAYVLGPDWNVRPESVGMVQRIVHLFGASGVRTRQSAIDVKSFYSEPRSTGERMAEYQRSAYPLGRAAVEESLALADGVSPSQITDLILVSCTGYAAPGIDIRLARDLALLGDVRRVVIGHMGCSGAIVGLRQSLTALAAHPDASVLLLTIELSSLHLARTLDLDRLTSFALFGDAAAAVLLSACPTSTGDSGPSGPVIVDTYCAADFDSAEQMSWTITDFGFIMGLSPRVPVTLRRKIRGVVERLLAPHGLTTRDVAHWLVHPGGPSILEAIATRLQLSEEQMALSWQVLAEHGNCSSATVLLILDQLLRERRAKPGEWGVMMAFGPGLTLETCLLRF
jgi:predicted naringenin-chalcone synthase